MPESRNAAAGRRLDCRIILERARRCEAIPDAGNRLDCKRRIWIVCGKFAELADAAVDGVVADGESTPTARDEIALRDDRATRMSERHKDLHHSPL